MRTEVNAGPLAMGAVMLTVGVGVGYLMYSHPEGLNPNWPIWVAGLAPLVFVIGGLHLLGAGLGYPRFAVAMIQLVVVCLWGMLHWYAFFTTNMQCRASLSFLGLEVLRRDPGEMACRAFLQSMVLILDAVMIIPAIVLAWRKRQETRRETKAAPPR